MKLPSEIRLVGLCILACLTETKAIAASHTDKADWEAAVAGLGGVTAEVDESQWAGLPTPFPAGSPINLPSGAVLTFAQDLVGFPNDTWCDGFAAPLYSADLEVDGTFDQAIDCFGLEMLPNPFIDVEMSLILSDGTEITKTVSALGDNCFFGWSDQPILSFTLKSETDFLFARLVQGINKSTPSTPDTTSSLPLFGLGLAGLALVRRARRSN